MAKEFQVLAFVRRRIGDVAKRVLRRDTQRRLDDVRKAAQCQFPTCDIEAMLAEIERHRSDEQPT
jgi:hypothetical protein